MRFLNYPAVSFKPAVFRCLAYASSLLFNQLPLEIHADEQLILLSYATLYFWFTRVIGARHLSYLHFTISKLSSLFGARSHPLF